MRHLRLGSTDVAVDYLIDTNVLIPLEPGSASDAERLTPAAARLVRLLSETGNRAVVHPESLRELGNDADPERRALRLIMATKYPQVETPVAGVRRLTEALGSLPASGHDYVDLQLLACVAAGAASFLVTEDVRLHRRAAAVRLHDQVLTVTEALELLRTLHERLPSTPPIVVSTTADEVEVNDPIFGSLRKRYPGFNEWWSRVAAQQRRVWCISAPDGHYAAICVIKEEAQGEHGLYGRVLKVCTFKVAEHAGGSRFGELLLATVFDYAHVNGYSTLFVEVDPSLGILIQFLEDFGFADSDRMTDIGDHVFVKSLRPPPGARDALDAFTFHRLYGPPTVRTTGVSAWLVPIQPGFHRKLLPSAEAQQPLVPRVAPHGNGIRKAYLCRATARSLEPGDLLYFYKSGEQIVTAAGIVEDVHVLSSAEDIVQAAGKRSVFSQHEIEEQAAGGELLVLGFRLVTNVDHPVRYQQLRARRVLFGPPQSIVRVKDEEGAKWLAEQMGLTEL